MFFKFLRHTWGFPSGSDGKESACNAGDLGSIPGLGRSPGGGPGNPLQYSCLENPHGQRSLVGYSLWDHKELDTTELTEHSTAQTYLHVTFEIFVYVLNPTPRSIWNQFLLTDFHFLYMGHIFIFLCVSHNFFVKKQRL